MKNAHAAVAFALAFLMLPVFALAEEPPQTLEAKMNAMLAATDDAYVVARLAVKEYIKDRGRAASDEMEALAPIPKYAALGVDMEAKEPAAYAAIEDGFAKAIESWSQGIRSMRADGQRFNPLMLPVICEPGKEPSMPATGIMPIYIPLNAATNAFLLSTLALGSRAVKGETGIVLQRMSEFGDVRRWIALRLLAPSQAQISPETATLLIDVCRKTASLEEKGFLYSASALVCLGSQYYPEFKSLFGEFGRRLPYAIKWTAEDDERASRKERNSLYRLPESLKGCFPGQGFFHHPIGYVLDMGRVAARDFGDQNNGPSLLFEPKGADSAPKPAAPAKPPAEGAQIPAPGLAVAVLLVGVMAFQVRKSFGRM